MNETFDFDTVVDRRRSHSIKWRRYGDDVLPMWVADMDFVSPEPVLRALHERIAHGVFGYEAAHPELIEAIVAWLARLNPLPVLLTGFLISGLLVGGDAIQLALNLPAATVHLFNGVILLFVLSGDLFTRYRVRIEFPARMAP
ncbi:MAG: hypothetical protein NZP34_02440, partial [Caldilineales bacterium]|nr:hypothetical protein [Caldilineales bacterium]